MMRDGHRAIAATARRRPCSAAREQVGQRRRGAPKSPADSFAVSVDPAVAAVLARERMLDVAQRRAAGAFGYARVGRARASRVAGAQRFSQRLASFLQIVEGSSRDTFFPLVPGVRLDQAGRRFVSWRTRWVGDSSLAADRRRPSARFGQCRPKGCGCQAIESAMAMMSKRWFPIASVSQRDRHAPVMRWRTQQMGLRVTPYAPLQTPSRAFPICAPKWPTTSTFASTESSRQPGIRRRADPRRNRPAGVRFATSDGKHSCAGRRWHSSTVCG